MNTTRYLILLAIHIISLVTAMGGVLVVDFSGLLWMAKRLQLKQVMSIADVTQKLIWLGWGGLVLSGSGLLYLKGYVDHLTEVKLFFVALVGANGLFMHVIKKSAQKIQGNTISPKLQFRITLASTISQVGWWSAIAIGFLHVNWKHFINWPPHPEIFMAAVSTLIIITALCGELIFKEN